MFTSNERKRKGLRERQSSPFRWPQRKLRGRNTDNESRRIVRPVPRHPQCCDLFGSTSSSFFHRHSKTTRMHTAEEKEMWPQNKFSKNGAAILAKSSGECCRHGTWHSGTPRGEMREIGGANTYVVLPRDREAALNRQVTMLNHVEVAAALRWHD